VKIRLSKRADADIDGIWSYIAEDNEDAADKVENAIRAAVHRLAANPGIGHKHPSVRIPRYRFWVVYSYLIAYTVKGQTLTVVRVVHGARDLGRIFRR
jgi:toxin ParE1/3/4